jgi:hypothetical protein
MSYKDHPDNILGTNSTNNSYSSSSVVANNDGSMIERLEAISAMCAADSLSKNCPNFLSVTVDFASTTWNTAASHEVFTVTGTVRVRLVVVCTENMADADNSGTMILGVAGSTSAFIGATTTTEIDANDFWCDTSPAETICAATSSVVLDRIIYNGADIGYTIANTAATNGTMIFYCWWEPLSSDGAVVAGAGGTL